MRERGWKEKKLYMCKNVPIHIGISTDRQTDLLCCFISEVRVNLSSNRLNIEGMSVSVESIG